MIKKHYDLFLKKKISSLFHDPPMKHSVSYEYRFPNIKLFNNFFIKYYNILGKMSHNIKPRSYHEKIAAGILSFIISNIKCIKRIYNIYDYKKSIKYVKTSDNLASSFDRIAIRTMHNNKIKLTLASKGIINIFNTNINKELSLEEPKSLDVRKLITILCDSITSITNKIDKSLSDDNHLSNDRNINILIRFLHLYFLLAEYMWYEASSGWAWGPADTRVPHHSLFDHLYATAAATNLLYGGRHHNEIDAGGVLVYVGLRGVGEWVRSSRKLSDAWIASWLASALVWYTVKELVWCLGPDILVLPGFRWNHLYLSLLAENGLVPRSSREKSGIEILDVMLKKWWWRGFPYYPVGPAEVVLVLPVNLDVNKINNSECKDIVDNQDPEIVAERVKEYIIEKYKRGWKEVVDSLKITAGKTFRYIVEVQIALDLAAEDPPLPIVVEAVPIRLRYDSRYNKYYVKIGYVEEKDSYRRDVLANLFEKLGVPEAKCFRGPCHPKEKYAISRVLYALGFYELSRRVRGRGVLPADLWWRVQARRFKRLRSLAESDSCGRVEPWRHCTVCRKGIAVIHVPGRDTKDGVSDEYKEFATRLCGEDADREECWRQWRPVFRPGERLCPHCLVKRLAGLPEFFQGVAERLIGYTPSPREVRFPSTDDLAAMATKVALLILASLAIEEEWVDVIDKLEELAREVTKVPHRSRIHKKLAEKIRNLEEENVEGGQLDLSDLNELVWDRLWTPELLFKAVVKLHKSLENRLGSVADQRIREKLLKAAAGALLAADFEFRDLVSSSREVSRILQELARMAYERSREAKCSKSSFTEALDEKSCSRLLSDVAEALRRPRLYYSIVYFDVDGGGSLKEGVISDGSRVIGARDYVNALVESLGKRYNSIKVKDNIMMLMRLVSSNNVWRCDSGMFLAEHMGSLLVTPSYHYAMANALSYTLLRAGWIASRLGGIPVYLAGDEGLVFLPAWMPRSFLWVFKNRVKVTLVDDIALHGESRGNVKDRFNEFVAGSSNVGLLYSALVRLVFWGATERHPGFHLVFLRYSRGYRAWFGVPALASTGLSMGLRFAHYRDHLYAEIAAARMLAKEAKRLGGDRLAASMGRVPPHSLGRLLESVSVTRFVASDNLSRWDDFYNIVDVERSVDANGRGRNVIRFKALAVSQAVAAALSALVESGQASPRLLRGVDDIVSGGARSLGEYARVLGKESVARLAEYLTLRHANSEELAGRVGGMVRRLTRNFTVPDEAWRELLEALVLARMGYESAVRGGYRES